MVAGFGRLVPMMHIPSARFQGTNWQKHTVRVGLGLGLVCHHENKIFFASSFKVSDIKLSSWNQTLLSALCTDITIQLGYQSSTLITNFLVSNSNVSNIIVTSWNQTLLSALCTDIKMQLGYQNVTLITNFLSYTSRSLISKKHYGFKYLGLPVILSVCLLFCLSICLSVFHSVCLTVYYSVCLSVNLSACLSVCQSICFANRLTSEWHI